MSLAIACIGCGGGSKYDMASVSGTVTLDGKPLGNATVLFSPVASGGSDAGPSSTGVTDATGRYTLKSGEGVEGAVVGKHQVRITTVTDTGEASGTDDDIYSEEGNTEKLPARYNSQTSLSIDVPAAGTEAANFDTTSGNE